MKGDQTFEYYDKRAGEYDRIYYRDNPERQGELKRLYEFSQDTLSGRHVLDIACGTGFWTRVISTDAASITGLDINRATLDEALRKKYECPVRFVQADLHNLSFKTSSFDGLLGTYVVSHVRREDLDRLGEDLRRIVKPGSTAFICDNNLICEIKGDLIWDEKHINSYKKRTLENGEEFLILKNYFDTGEIVSIFQKWGRIDRMIYENYYWAVLLTFPED